MKKLNSFLEITEKDLEKLVDLMFKGRFLRVALQTKDRIECEISWDLIEHGKPIPMDETIVFTKCGVGTSFENADMTDENEIFEKFLVARGLSRYQMDNPFLEEE